MFKSFLSFVFIVLISWTLTDANAASKKLTKKVTASNVVTKIVKAKVAKVVKVKKPAPSKKKIVAKKKKPVAMVHMIPIPSLKKMTGKVVKKVTKRKAPDPVQVKCLAKLGLGEAGAEPPMAQKAVLYVAKHYSEEMTLRSVCKETRDKERYSYLLFPRNLNTIARTVNADGDDWAGVKTRAAEVLSSYPEPPIPILKHATTYLVVEDSSIKGKNWIMDNTYPLGFCGVTRDFKIGKHVFRTERNYAWEKLEIVCPQQKPYALAKLIAQRAFKKLASSK